MTPTNSEIDKAIDQEKLDGLAQDTLDPYVTSTTDDVYCVKNLPGLVGAVMARYSRSPDSLREIIRREFVREGVFDHKRADDLIDRVLNQFGDDSVGELEGAHACLENVSNLATKAIEDRRIGGSPIERSTRYVMYDEKVDGRWPYVIPDELVEGTHVRDYYVEAMDQIFERYAELSKIMIGELERRLPLEKCEYPIGAAKTVVAWRDATEPVRRSLRRVHQMTLRTKACDLSRGLLPTASRANVGVFGNGRFYTNVVTHLCASRLGELRRLGKELKGALDQVIPRYVARASTETHVGGCQYLRRVEDVVEGWWRTRVLSQPCLSSAFDYAGERGCFTRVQGVNVTRVDDLDFFGKRVSRDAAVAAEIVYPIAPRVIREGDVRHVSLATLRHICNNIESEDLAHLFKALRNSRRSRRDKLPRGAEAGYPLIFDVVSDWGAYRDLERHRMMTQQRQLITPNLGFIVYDGIEDLGGAHALGLIEEAVAISEALYDQLNEFGGPDLAQYAVLMGHRVQWYMGMNLRQAAHLSELRSGPQGHATYREIAHRVKDLTDEVMPLAGEMMQYVDRTEVFLPRAASEARTAAKELAAGR